MNLRLVGCGFAECFEVLGIVTSQDLPWSNYTSSVNGTNGTDGIRMLSLCGPYGEAKQFALAQGFGEGRERWRKAEVGGRSSLAGTDAPQKISRAGILQGGPRLLVPTPFPQNRTIFTMLTLTKMRSLYAHHSATFGVLWTEYMRFGR